MAPIPRDRNRVVVTGMGALTCLGRTPDQTWEQLLAGRSGIRRIVHPDSQDVNVFVCGEILGFDPVADLGGDWAYLGDRYSQIGLAAALQAVAHAGLDPDSGDLREAAIIIANAHNNCGRDSWGHYGYHGGIDERFTTDGFIDLLLMVRNGFTSKYAPYPVDQDVAYRQNFDYPTHLLARRFESTGPMFTPSCACASGVKSIERGLRFLRRGTCEIAVCGGTESVIDPWGFWFLGAMRALTTYNNDPEHASRPFDTDRTGFVLSEGAGVLILETLDHARRRDAPILAEVAGIGASANSNSLYAPESVGDSVAACMSAALRDARVEPDAIDVIFAHATATGIGDPAEADGIHMALGAHAPEVALTAPKSMIGHAIAAAGALGAIQCIQSIRDQRVPPTINLDHPDPCVERLHVVTGGAEDRPIQWALGNAFGFGGSNGTMVFRRFDE